MNKKHLFFLAFLFVFFSISARDPFNFVEKLVKKEKRNIPKIIAVPELRGTVSSDDGCMALLYYKKGPYIVGEGQTIDQWRVCHLSSGYIIVEDNAGTRKKIFLSPDIM